MKIFLMFSLIISILCSCAKDGIFKDDELTLNKKEFLGDELRMDGYYYNQYGQNEKLTIYFFYRNGVLLLAGDGYEMSKIEEFEKSFTTEEFIERRRGIKFSWGVFQTEVNTIKFERWYPSERPYKAYVRAGEILNDSTFLITESYRLKNGKKTEVSELNETYNFRQFSPKPDSTNNFIK